MSQRTTLSLIKGGSSTEVAYKELLDELGLSQYRLAHDIGVSAVGISHLVNEKRPLTAELALRLGRYFGQTPRY